MPLPWQRRYGARVASEFRSGHSWKVMSQVLQQERHIHSFIHSFIHSEFWREVGETHRKNEKSQLSEHKVDVKETSSLPVVETHICFSLLHLYLCVSVHLWTQLNVQEKVKHLIRLDKTAMKQPLNRTNGKRKWTNQRFFSVFSYQIAKSNNLKYFAANYFYYICLWDLAAC